jgi:putative tryptophan/tyrosine transport system substrate-binding protein
MTHTLRGVTLVVAILTLVFAPLARAQTTTKVPRIGYLFSFAPAEGQHLWEACRLGLRDLGYVEGHNIVLEPRWADGRHERMPELVAELVRLKVDVIVAAATPANIAAKAGAGSIPIVMVAVSDPVRIGLVASLARPGGNMTGLSLLTPELSGKRLQLLMEIVRQSPRVATLSNPANLSHAVFSEETQNAARQLQVQIQALKARNPDEIERAFEEAAREGANAMIVFDDPVIWGHRKHVVALARKTRIPVMYGYSEFVDEGGLISYGPNRPDLYRSTAAYVDKILKGAKPAELPIERPKKFELFVNLKTAKALGLTIPPSLLLRADRVIE